MEAYVFVFANEGKVPLALAPSTPVSEAKAIVLKNIPTDMKISAAAVRRVRLLANGRELRDEETLEKLGQSEQKFVHVVLLQEDFKPQANRDSRECCEECSVS